MQIYSAGNLLLLRMLKLYAILIMLVVGVFGTPPKNKASPTTAPPISTFLSKFHQNDFKLIYERTELARTDPDLAKVYVRTFKYNRTTAVFNGNGILSIDVGYDAEVIVQAYRFASNEYREFPMRFQFNFCQGITSSAFGMDQLIKFGNFRCPILKETWYNITNFTPDPERFPPGIPSGRYMLEFLFMYQDKEMFALYNYGTIDRPIPIPHKGGK